ncbi:MAG TPA: RNA polymerase sigma factor [Planctomycetia bacterium]|nr:RNA polymerase sigma factor [Planctomycetia bacterium]
MTGDDLAELLPGAFRYAMRLTAGDEAASEDLVQEACLRALHRTAPLREPGARKVWLLRIVANVHCDGVRRRRHPAGSPAALENESPAGGIDPARRAAVKDDLAAVLAAADRLPPRQREVLHLVAVEQLDLSQAAEVLGVSVEAAKASLSLARQRLRAEFEGVANLGRSR